MDSMNEDEKKPPQPVVDGDQIVAPEPPEPQDSVGSEGGAAPLRSPTIVETDGDEERLE